MDSSTFLLSQACHSRDIPIDNEALTRPHDCLIVGALFQCCSLLLPVSRSLVCSQPTTTQSTNLSITLNTMKQLRKTIKKLTPSDTTRETAMAGLITTLKALETLSDGIPAFGGPPKAAIRLAIQALEQAEAEKAALARSKNKGGEE